MSMLTKVDKARYISILADGKFHETVPEGTPDAVKREYETSDKQKGTKWELLYTKIEAMITDVRFRDGDYGLSLNIRFKDEENNEVVVSVNTASNFGEDLMKKLPNVDFTKKVKLIPFAFEDERKRSVRGVNVIQLDEAGKEVKLRNYFSVPLKKGEEPGDREREYLHGFPAPEGDTEKYTKDHWKIWFTKVRLFLVEYTEKNIVAKFFGEVGQNQQVDRSAIEYPKEEINPDDIPF